MKRLCCRKAFTLIEVMVGVVAFALGVLALYKLLSATVLTNSYAYRQSQAMTIAQERMEGLITLPYDNAALNDNDPGGGHDGTGQDANADGIDDNGGNFGLDDTVGAGDEGADGNLTSGIFTTYWNVAVDQPVANCKTVRVIATWRGSSNIEHRVTLTSVKSLF